MIDLTSEQIADFTTTYDYLCVETPLPERADAIVVGGSYSWTDMADRAAQLYLRGGWHHCLLFLGLLNLVFLMKHSLCNQLAKKLRRPAKD